MDGASILLNLAYAVLVSATLFRDLFRLRIMLIIGTIGFVVYGLVVGNPTIAAWNFVTGSMHSVQLTRLIKTRRSVQLTDEDEQYRQLLCPGTDRYDFYLLWSIGDEVVREDEPITRQGVGQQTLLFILDGTVRVTIDGEHVADRAAGSLIGELSYLSGGSATADTDAVGRVRAREWDQHELAALEAANPASARALHTMISRSIAARSR